MRRMLGDLGHDIESSILGIIDMNYASTNSPIKKLNVKGLIESDSTRKAIRPKMVYYAMQNIVAIFDNNLLRIKGLHSSHNSNPKDIGTHISYNKSTDRSLAVYGYANKKTKKQIFTI